MEDFEGGAAKWEWAITEKKMKPLRAKNSSSSHKVALQIFPRRGARDIRSSMCLPLTPSRMGRDALRCIEHVLASISGCTLAAFLSLRGPT